MTELIRIQTKAGPKMIEAELVGEFFAVHPTTYTDGISLNYWTVTHVPSGFCARHNCVSSDAAKKVAARLEEVPVDWANVTSADDKLLKPHLMALSQAVRLDT